VEPIPQKLCFSRPLEAFVLCASRLAGCSAVRGFVLRALPMARWDVWDDAWDNGFLKLAFGASRWNLANHRQRASRKI